MCGRFVSLTEPDFLARLFEVDEDRQAAEVGANPNVAPTEQVRAVAEHDGRRVLVTLVWGLVPRWSKDRRGASKLINARAETLTERPAYREAFTRRRCLLPADGYYEWIPQPDGARAPYLVTRRDGAPLALAGLWDVWRDPADPTAPPLRTCTIVTTSTNDALAPLHHRMPVVLERGDWDDWLDRDVRDPATLTHLLRPAAEHLLHYRPVSAAVNDARMKDTAAIALS